MQLLDHVVNVKTRSESFRIYPIGDAHIGANNFAEHEFKKYIARIADDDNAIVIGGGDLLDAVIIQDQKRFSPDNLPDWMLVGAPDNIRERLNDMITAQIAHTVELLTPIRHKLIGLIEGNHEYSIRHYHNRDVMEELASALETQQLTDCAFVRFKFIRTKGKSVASVRLFICHGNGGGRTAGAEPNHLTRLVQDKECELVLRGHSHIFTILPPIPRLYIPSAGKMPKHAITKDIRVANWGTWLFSYSSGPSTYASRANYPVRPMCTVYAEVTPFNGFRTSTGLKDTPDPVVTLHEIVI